MTETMKKRIWNVINANLADDGMLLDDIVIAVLEAMREPTEGMIFNGIYRGGTKDCWKKMIDAAINEK